MRRIVLFLSILILYSGKADAQIFSEAYGNPADKPIIFMHGGPGFNSAIFEFTTAEKLAAKGYYIIVYDQRGSGRSDTAGAQYTFAESNSDILSLYSKYNIKKAILMGHSWGGAVAVKFAREHPQKVSQVIFVSAPVSYPATFESMLTRLKGIYKDSTAIASELEATGNAQAGSIEYASGIFKYAMRGGFYSPREATEEAKVLYSVLFKPEISKIFASMTGKPSEGFFNNENYLSLDLSADILSLKDNIIFSGIYGDEDGLFEPATLKSISSLTGENNFRVISKASHNVFIDQQQDFIDAVEQLTK